MNENEKIREELNSYIDKNFEIIESIYSKYIELVDKIKLEKEWVWPKDQLAALMIVAEEKHLSLMERLEFELEKNKLDPFSSPKLSSYIIAKNNNGGILLSCFKDSNSFQFAIQFIDSKIFKDLNGNNFYSIGSLNDR